MKSRNGSTIVKRVVMISDFILLNVILLLLFYLYPGILEGPGHEMTILFFTCNFAMIVAEWFFGAIIHLRHIDFGRIISRVSMLALTQALVFFFLTRATYNVGGMFNVMVWYSLVLFLSLICKRAVERFIINRYRRLGKNVRNIIFVGSDPANLMVYRDLMDDVSAGYKAVGYYSNDIMDDCPDDLKKLGSLDDFKKMIVGDLDSSGIPQADDIFCCLSHDEASTLIAIMSYCDKHIIRFYYVPRMLGNILLGLKSERVGNLDLFTNHKDPLADSTNRFVKRLFDIVVSGIVCIVMLPFIPIIALIIKMQSKGPVFFSQDRTGLDGKTFKCYKFRSMHVNKDADKAQATENDPRKFPFGSFMRKTNIDEFPQFFNVLRGDMSIVGPRPHMLLHTELYSGLIGKYMVRHFAKPGITGYAQITGFRGETKELWQMKERVHRDIWYIENWSLWLDIRIIFQTAVTIFKTDDKAY